MRFDKLTTKFQQALNDAQSLALGNDNGFIEPQHLLAALLAQEDGGTASLLARAGVAVPRLQNGAQAVDRAAAEGRRARAARSRISRDLNNLLNLTDKEAIKRGDQFIASELFLLALDRRQGRHRPHAEGGRPHPQGARGRDRRGARRRAASTRRKPKASARRSPSTRSTSRRARATASSTR